MKPLVLFLSLWASSLALASQWRLPGGVVGTGPLFSEDRPECRDLATYSSKPWNSTPEGFIVAKGGVIQFEYYDPIYGPNRPHALWSVTKTFTGALLGIAVQEGRVGLDQRLSEFYPAQSPSAAYESIRVENLFYSDTGFAWDESALDVARNSVFQALFARGRVDTANYVTHRPVMDQGAGYHWQYTTGTPTVAMGVLRKVYGTEYDAFPWRALFNPLGMSSVVFEQDPAGNFIGGAYGFATPRDLLKLGQLYLQRGKWNGQTILSEDWINRTLTVSPGFMAKGTTREQIADGLNLVYGGLIWLNRQGRPDLPKPFPLSPDDMFMALGRNGQFMIVVPSQDLVLVRTGANGHIDDRIDGIVTRAMACVGDPATPIADQPPAPVPNVPGPSIGKTLEILKEGLRSSVLQAAVAKWVCSCHFVSGLTVDACLKRGDVPHAGLIVDLDVSETSVTAKPTQLAKLVTGAKTSRIAAHDPTRPELGCWTLP